MIELVAMLPLQGLLPLEGTLPGWPEAPQPSILPTMFLAIGIPLIIGIIITILVKGSELGQTARENGVAVGLPVSNQRLALEAMDREGSPSTESNSTGSPTGVSVFAPSDSAGSNSARSDSARADSARADSARSDPARSDPTESDSPAPRRAVGR